MPYIKDNTLREIYDSDLVNLISNLSEEGWKSGDATYVLFRLAKIWFEDNPCYNTIAQIRGVFTGTLTEFDRRIAAPYEDKKIRENGDVHV